MVIAKEQHFCEERFKRSKKYIHAALAEKNTVEKENSRNQVVSKRNSRYQLSSHSHDTQKSSQ
jgi:hypothetical protein